MQKFVEQITGQLEPQLHARLKESFDRASQELENTAAQVSERQFANFTEGTQAVFQEALLQLDARMAAARPLFENAMNVPSPEHMETLLHSMKAGLIKFPADREEDFRPDLVASVLDGIRIWQRTKRQKRRPPARSSPQELNSHFKLGSVSWRFPFRHSGFSSVGKRSLAASQSKVTPQTRNHF